MEPERSADVVIVGLGAIGAATAYQARRRGLSIIGIDRAEPPHQLGSTHAESRITRLAVGEGPQYLPTVRRSHQIWRELEERSGRSLFYQCGGLIVTGPSSSDGRWDDFVTRTHAVATGAGIEFELLDPDRATAKHAALLGLENERIGFEPTAGLVDCEAAVSVQLGLARRDGAELRTNEEVLRVEPDEAGVDVVTDRGRYRADQVVLAAGPWLAELAPAVDAAALRVTRQVVFWFEADDLSAFAIDAVPFVMWIGETIDDYLAVFPPMPDRTPAVKVLGEQFAVSTDPRSVERTVSPSEVVDFHRRSVEPRVSGVSSRCVRAEVCLYTNTPDDDFLIDTTPSSDRVVVVSACSGHGFKHSAAIGEAVAQRLATGTADIDLSGFSRRRLDAPNGFR